MSDIPPPILQRALNAPAGVLSHLQSLQDACARWPMVRPQDAPWPPPADALFDVYAHRVCDALPGLARGSDWIEPFVLGLFVGAALAGVGYVAYRVCAGLLVLGERAFLRLAAKRRARRAGVVS